MSFILIGSVVLGLLIVGALVRRSRHMGSGSDAPSSPVCGDSGWSDPGIAFSDSSGAGSSPDSGGDSGGGSSDCGGGDCGGGGD